MKTDTSEKGLETLIMRPNGAPHTSLGQRPRSRSADDSPALKRRLNRNIFVRRIRAVRTPLQGLIHGVPQPRALPWAGMALPLWGVRQLSPTPRQKCQKPGKKRSCGYGGYCGYSVDLIRKLPIFEG